MPFPTAPILNGSGSLITVNTLPNAGQNTMAESLPVTISSNQSAVPVSGTFWQATQPVSLTSLPALATGANVIGGVTQSGTWNVTISNASLAATQSGTWNIGTVTTVSTVTSLSQFGGQAIALGAGAVTAGALRITQASDSPLVTATGTSADTAYTGSGSGTLISLQKWIGAGIASLVTASSSAAPSNVNLGTDALSNNGTSLTPKFAKIVASASGATTLVALVASKKIRVLQFWLTGNGAVNAKFQSHVTPTDLSGLVYIAAAGGGISAPFCPLGLFETVAGEALDINLSGAVAVGGGLVYVEV